MSLRLVPATIAALVGMATIAAAQTPGQPAIADVARRTEAARASTATKKAAKTYTNKDLHAVPMTESQSTAVVSATPADVAAADKPEVGKPDATAPGEARLTPEEEAKLNAVPEQMWRLRAGRIREQAAALQETLRQIRARPRNPNPARQEQNDKEEARMVNAMNALKKQWTALESQARDAKINLTWLEPLPSFPQ